MHVLSLPPALFLFVTCFVAALPIVNSARDQGAIDALSTVTTQIRESDEKIVNSVVSHPAIVLSTSKQLQDVNLSSGGLVPVAYAVPVAKNHPIANLVMPIQVLLNVIPLSVGIIGGILGIITLGLVRQLYPILIAGIPTVNLS